MKNITKYILFLLFVNMQLNAQIVLLGENPPHTNVNDGDFNAVKGYWREAKQSPFWTTKIVKGNSPMGLHYGTLFSSNEIGIAESKILNTNPELQQLKVGDTLNWSFGADLEYKSNGTISLSLVFEDQERILAEKVKLVGSDKTVEHFKGTYIVTEKDSRAGFPFVRATFYSEQDVKVYLHYVNISKVAPERNGPHNLSGQVKNDAIELSWKDKQAKKQSIFFIYRSKIKESKYNKIGETKTPGFSDKKLITGIKYTYLVTRFDGKESAPSNMLTLCKKDTLPPLPPAEIKTVIFDTEVKLSWAKNKEVDIKSYSIYRGDANGKNMKEIASNISDNSFEDLNPIKGLTNTYLIYAHDYSGNKSKSSKIIKAQVKAVFGSSFRDLILPMPIHNELRSDIWGANGVIPRDPENGIEHPDWSYWGGRPMKDKDGKYHMLVVRWPEKGMKGHWEWPNSTVVHSISDKPTGPYIATNNRAYEYANGLGHNADVTKLNDGRYLLYSLINWEPTLFTSTAMEGPWQLEGIMKIEYNADSLGDSRTYQVERNLSGIQLKDGSMLFVSKFGRMIKSESGLLGPYKVLTDVIQKNKTIPERYRNSNYEDPTMWRDEVQFHCLINAFIDKRAIYLRSPDGINWKFDPGIAYDPYVTSYEDGTKTHWHKLERPHVIQDEFGRATHLSLAALDVPKREDLSNDKHNSKNIIIPLQVHRRIKMLNTTKVDSSTKKIKILILSEEGFDAQTDVDILSLRYGASEEVNFGKGSKVIHTINKGNDLLVEFNGNGNGISDKNFVGKLLGKTRDGNLIIAFSKLKAD